MILMTFWSRRAREIRARRKDFRRLKALCGDRFTYWWSVAGDRVDQKLRYAGMRWDQHDYGVTVDTGAGMHLHHTKRMGLHVALDSFLREEKQCPSHVTDVIRACEKFRLGAALRRMEPAMRQEAERRLTLLEAALDEVRASVRYTSLLVRVPNSLMHVHFLLPYGHPTAKDILARAA